MGKLGYIDAFRFSLPTSVNDNKQDFSFSCQRHSTAGMLGIYKIPVSPGQVAHLPVLQHQRTGSQHSAFFQSTCLFILLAPGNQFQPAFLYEYSSIGHCCQNPGRGSIYHHPVLTQIADGISGFHIKIGAIDGRHRTCMPGGYTGLLLGIVDEHIEAVALRGYFKNRHFLRNSIQRTEYCLFIKHPFLQGLSLPIGRNDGKRVGSSLRHCCKHAATEKHCQEYFLFHIDGIGLN